MADLGSTKIFGDLNVAGDIKIGGTPTAPTAIVSTNTTQLATTAFVNAEIANDTYSKTQLDAGQLDNRYYTETESDALYEPIDATILKDADIGVNVQSYNAATTLQGNTFNGNSQLVKTTVDGKLPVIDGSNLTGIVVAGAVDLTTNQTVGGIKTFTSSPIVPTATNANQAVNKGQLDANTFQVATIAEAQTGIDNIKGITPLRLRDALNASGTAPIYACRAWVNFNGTGTVAIRASGNVSSITDNGVGNPQLNFIESMPHENYSASFMGSSTSTTQLGAVWYCQGDTKTLSSFELRTSQLNVSGANIPEDLDEVCVNIIA